MNYGYRLAELRTDKKLSQKELGEIFGISQSYIGQMESGDRKIPSDKAVEMAEYFDVSTDYLLGRAVRNSSESDLKSLLRDGSMTYGGKEISEKNLKVIAGVVRSFLDEMDER